MAQRSICILGGSGFVGRSLCARLVTLGHQVKVLTRRAFRQRDLLVLPTLKLVEGDPYNGVWLQREFAGCDTVVNLVGTLNQSRRQGFEQAHVELPRKIIEGCRVSGVRRLLHMSALNASIHGPSEYLRSKGRGEELVHAASGLQVTSFRPSVIFGPRDSFVNRFAALLRLAPGVFPLACPEAKFQPVYVEDVIECFVRALDDSRCFGGRYDLCGSKVHTLRKIVEYIAQLLGKRVRIVGLNDRLSWLQAAVMEFVPGKPFSLDNYRSLQVDCVCQHGFPPVFGLTPAALENIVPTYVGHRSA